MWKRCGKGSGQESERANLTMSKAAGDEGGGADGSSHEKAQQLEDHTLGEKDLGKLSAIASGSGWTKVSCPCCVSDRVEPLILVKLGEKVRPETKRWLIKLIGAPLKDGDNMEVFLTLAERQYIVKYELDGLRAQRDVRIPGLSDDHMLQNRDNIWQKLGSARVIMDTFPLHKPQQLKELSEAWYSGNQLAQPLDSVNGYFGSTVAFYFSFLDFYTWSLLPPAILGLCITYFSGSN
ncbi:hypothetical protein INR49_012474 [Caranx melampygus]|nr:hypothetical protein INR49_012474 [Caranx melampygus]